MGEGSAVAGGGGPIRVLRVSHSSVVTAWRERERALADLGADPVTLTARRWSEAGGLVDLDVGTGEEVQGLRTFGTHPCGFVYDPVGLWRALRRAARHGVDVLDVHEEPYALATCEVVVLARAARLGCPLVVYTAQNLDKRRSLAVRLAQSAVLARASAAYPCSEEAGALLRRHGFQGVLSVLPLGVAGVAPPDGGGSRAPHGPARVGFAGRLTAEKGPLVLLRAAASEGWQLSFAGDGPLRRDLQQRAAELGMADRVGFEGLLSGDALAAWYHGLDVLAVPSVPTPGWIEQFGRVVVEAFALGVPVVASRSGALPEVVGPAGLLVDPGDVDALREALRSVLSNQGLRDRLVESGRRRADTYLSSEVASKQLDLYRAVDPAARAPLRATVHLPPLVVVVVAYGRPDLLARTLAPLGDHLDVLVVDNSSSAEVAGVTRRAGARYLDAGANLGFAAAVNVALAGREDPVSDVLLLNPDAEVGLDVIEELRRRLHGEARVATVAPAQCAPGGQRQRVVWPFPTPWGACLQALGLGAVRRPGFVIGSVMLLNGAALAEVGCLDERFFLYAEETDWQLRARSAGWGYRYFPDLEAVHVGGATGASDPERRERLFWASQRIYMRKWYGPGGWAVYEAATVTGELVRATIRPRRRRHHLTVAAQVVGARRDGSGGSRHAS